ncbi:MAG: hypothetical protein ACI4DV_05050 [Lachnospiraceae bacterium]
MTAEERMAYFQGEKRRDPLYSGKKEKNRELTFLKMKFFICMILFVLFLSLDYTGYEIKGIGSVRIVQMVRSNAETLQNAEEIFADLFKGQ